MKLSNRSALLGLAAVFALLLVAGAAQAGEAGKPMVVKIHADWCGTCTRLNSTFEDLQVKVGDDAVLIVLDVTDRSAVEKSRARAEELGIVAFFDEYKSKTGTVGVLDAEGNEVVVLKGETDADKYVAAVAKAKEA
jgi:thiol:disulfide interchange protein